MATGITSDWSFAKWQRLYMDLVAMKASHAKYTFDRGIQVQGAFNDVYIPTRKYSYIPELDQFLTIYNSNSPDRADRLIQFFNNIPLAPGQRRKQGWRRNEDPALDGTLPGVMVPYNSDNNPAFVDFTTNSEVIQNLAQLGFPLTFSDAYNDIGHVLGWMNMCSNASRNVVLYAMSKVPFSDHKTHGAVTAQKWKQWLNASKCSLSSWIQYDLDPLLFYLRKKRSRAVAAYPTYRYDVQYDRNIESVLNLQSVLLPYRDNDKSVFYKWPGYVDFDPDQPQNWTYWRILVLKGPAHPLYDRYHDSANGDEWTIQNIAADLRSIIIDKYSIFRDVTTPIPFVLGLLLANVGNPQNYVMYQAVEPELAPPSLNVTIVSATAGYPILGAPRIDNAQYNDSLEFLEPGELPELYNIFKGMYFIVVKDPNGDLVALGEAKEDDFKEAVRGYLTAIRAFGRNPYAMIQVVASPAGYVDVEEYVVGIEGPTNLFSATRRFIKQTPALLQQANANPGFFPTEVYQGLTQVSPTAIAPLQAIATT